jgi:hypothetical protein
MNRAKISSFPCRSRGSGQHLLQQNTTDQHTVDQQQRTIPTDGPFRTVVPARTKKQQATASIIMVRSLVLVLASCLTGSHQVVQALIINPSWSKSQQRRPRDHRPVVLARHQHAFFASRNNRGSQLHAYEYSDFSTNDGGGEDDGCANEEECEIDWDNMPGFVSTGGGGDNNSNDDDTNKAAASSSPSRTTTETTTSSSSALHQNQSNVNSPGKNQSQTTMTSAASSSTGNSIASMRQRLEMNWQLAEVAEECDVFKPVTCGGSPCRVCRTSGRMACRFCHGRMYNEQLGHASCTICDERGTEVCSNCRGSGWVADWTAHGTHSGAAPTAGDNDLTSSSTIRWSKLAP